MTAPLTKASFLQCSGMICSSLSERVEKSPSSMKVLILSLTESLICLNLEMALEIGPSTTQRLVLYHISLKMDLNCMHYNCRSIV